MEKYKGFIITKDDNGSGQFMAYSESEGIQHDADFDGDSYKYCGNCFFGSVEDLKGEIDEAFAMEEPLKEDLAYNTTEGGFNERKFNEAYSEWEIRFGQ